MVAHLKNLQKFGLTLRSLLRRGNEGKKSKILSLFLNRHFGVSVKFIATKFIKF